MGIKLYPPYIEGTLPAFTKGTGITISVPFSMNKSVAKSQVQGFVIKIKSVQTNNLLMTLFSDSNLLDSILENKVATFNIPYDSSYMSDLNPGCYYKIQMAYVNNYTIGYYSTVGVIKCTTQPNIFIKGFEEDGIKAYKQSYTGVYSQYGQDLSEKVYQYKFDLYSINDALMVSQYDLVESSGWLLHDSTTDVDSYESTDSYLFSTSLRSNVSYKVQYSVLTKNQLEVSSPQYVVMEKNGVTPEINAYLKYDVNFDNGYIRLYLQPYNWTSVANGAFLISRASSEDNYETWYELERFTLRDEDNLESWELKDFTVKQGVKYIYAIQQYNSKGLYSSRLRATGKDSESIYAYADFEDSFLFDGEKQLKIRFNTKVSTFKADKMESKLETIGSKYPFIFRNGKVDYKEFQISGLISYWSDEEHLFLSDEEMGLNGDLSSKQRTYFNSLDFEDYNKLDFKPWTTQQVGYNFAAERIFKLKVMEWLGNGKPKLFRTPSEGNYLVKLMNVSFTPEDKISRLVHNFSATAYEIGDASYKSLGEHGITSITEPADVQYRIMTFDFYNDGQPLSGFTCNNYEKDGDYSSVVRTYTKNYAGYHMKFTPSGLNGNSPALSGYEIDGNINVGDTITLVFSSTATVLSITDLAIDGSKIVIGSASSTIPTEYNLSSNRSLVNKVKSYTWTSKDTLPFRIYWSVDTEPSQAKDYTLDLKSVTVNGQEILNSTFTPTVSSVEKSEKVTSLNALKAFYEDSIYQALTNFQTQITSIEQLYNNNTITINQKYTAISNLVNEKDDKIKIYESRFKELNTEIAEINSLTVGTPKINKFNVYEYIKFRDILPGTRFQIYDKTAEQTISIVIGITGSYTVELPGHTFSLIQTQGDFPSSGFVDYKYIAEAENNFEEINDIDVESVYGRSFVGPMTIIDENAEYDKINDIKHNLVSFYYTNFYTKNIRVLKQIGSSYYDYDEITGTCIALFENFIDNEIYKIYLDNGFKYYSGGHELSNLLDTNSIDYTINIDGEILLLTPDSEEGLLNHLLNGFRDQNFSKIIIGNGIVLDCAYTYSNTTYNVEIENTELAEDLENYKQACANNANEAILERLWRNYCEKLKTYLRRVK